MYANITVIGNIGKADYIDDAKNPCIRVSVAVNASYKDKSGDEYEKTTWYSTALYHKSAIDHFKGKLHPGDLVLLCGEPEFKSYMDKNGKPQTDCHIFVGGFDGTFKVLRYKEPRGHDA
jgi:single-stranded DNA-binding protein